MKTVKVRRGQQFITRTACRMCISVGARVYENGGLQIILEWILDRFEGCTVVVADTLQRHNLPQSLSEAQREHRAMQNGDTWLLHHESTLGKFSHRIKIERWNNLLHRPTFFEHVQSIADAYEVYPAFREAVECDINSYLRRKQVPPHTYLELRSGGQKYILEELAVIALLEATIPSVEVYPGAQLHACKVFKQLKLENATPYLSGVRFVELNISDHDTTTPMQDRANS